MEPPDSDGEEEGEEEEEAEDPPLDGPPPRGGESLQPRQAARRDASQHRPKHEGDAVRHLTKWDVDDLLGAEDARHHHQQPKGQQRGGQDHLRHRESHVELGVCADGHRENIGERATRQQSDGEDADDALRWHVRHDPDSGQRDQRHDEQRGEQRRAEGRTSLPVLEDGTDPGRLGVEADCEHNDRDGKVGGRKELPPGQRLVRSHFWT